MGTRPARGKEHKPFLVLDLIAAVAALAVTPVVTLLQRIIEFFVVILIAIHIPTFLSMIPLDNSFVVGIAAVSVFVGIVGIVRIVRVFVAGIPAVGFVGIVGIGGVSSEFACL